VRRTTAAYRSSTLIKGWSCGTVLLLNAFTADTLLGQTANDSDCAYRNVPLPRLSSLTVAARPAKLQSRWDRFEAEFGLPDERASLLTASLLRAKYSVDVALFSIKMFSATLGDATELRYSRGRIRRAATVDSDRPHRSAHHDSPIVLEDARLKLVFDMASSRPYIGVRLVLPFGD